MNLFNKLPGFVRSPPGLEQRIWRRLPAILLWGTLLPLGLAGLNRALAPAAAESGADAKALLDPGDYEAFTCLDASGRVQRRDGKPDYIGMIGCFIKYLS